MGPPNPDMFGTIPSVPGLGFNVSDVQVHYLRLQQLFVVEMSLFRRVLIGGGRCRVILYRAQLLVPLVCVHPLYSSVKFTTFVKVQMSVVT